MAMGLLPSEPVKDLCGGRLVAFDPEATLSDGVANQDSEGFFDDDNCPPYDTWVLYVYEEAYGRSFIPPRPQKWESFESYLVAWVPPWFLERVDWGIAVNPEVCIMWLDEMDTPFAQALRERGLFG
jgi:hypothetical protein